MFKILYRLTALALLSAFLFTSCNSDKHKVLLFQKRIKHIVVIYQENWSFDGLYGNFPGANNLSKAHLYPQLNKDGSIMAYAPQPYSTIYEKPSVPDSAYFPSKMPPIPYDLQLYVDHDHQTGDLIHEFYTEQQQIDGGKMDKFISWSNDGGLVMSYFDATNLPEGKLAQQYTLCDNFFHSAFGGSFLNHIWLVAAASPKWDNAPGHIISQPDQSQPNFGYRQVTPDGYVVNTSMSVNEPHPAGMPDSMLVPNQTMPTIGDELSAAGVSWKWYSGGWDDAIAGHPDPDFQYHHQPFVYFANYKDGTAAKAQHLQDETQLLRDLGNDSLPEVSFVKPLGHNNEHPGYSNVLRGQEHVAALVKMIMNSKYWDSTAIIITYDENGGRWDHAAPPVIDRWGPGTRVPAIVISPFARRGYVDHTQYETTSVLKFIETRYGLKPLSTRDANANDLLNAFMFY
ncbi:MAG TPA: alkaline phosphatase family protein [Chitinophagales bacterium]|nr:alkaline phosphatase family protein [Chitinophagales bacterium]